jgi:N-acyl homoserine lactone hydrolase
MSMTIRSWRVWALRAGRSRMDQSVATYLEGMGQPLIIPHTMFVLAGPRLIVVDTSFESVEAVSKAYPQDIWRDPAEEPRELLARIGFRPDEVELVICTHLHYDHCGSNSLFSRARVLVQRVELAYALNPVADMMRREFFSPPGGFNPPFNIPQMELIDGDRHLGNGLDLLLLPGHTPGSQGVIVETGTGRLGLLGDNVMVEENWQDRIPVGLHTDVDAWYRSIAKANAAVDRVAPSHDLRLFPEHSLVTELS